MAAVASAVQEDQTNHKTTSAGAAFMDPSPLIKITRAIESREDPTKFRNIVKQVSGTQITSVQAQQFLDVFEDDLKASINKARRDFVEKHFGNKNTNK